MKTKTNKIPLVGPRGRQEILKKVEQIAQQDYLKVIVPNGSDIIDILTQEKTTEFAKRGVLFDIVIVCLWEESKGFGRILGYVMDSDETKVTSFLVGIDDAVQLFEYE